MCQEAGKHIICEKPVAVSAVDLQSMIDVCNRFNVLFMDGVMFMHHCRLNTMRAAISDPCFGVSYLSLIKRLF